MLMLDHELNVFWRILLLGENSQILTILYSVWTYGTMWLTSLFPHAPAYLLLPIFSATKLPQSYGCGVYVWYVLRVYTRVTREWVPRYLGNYVRYRETLGESSHFLLPLLFPSLFPFSFPSPYNPARGSEGPLYAPPAYPSRARPPNAFWCIYVKNEALQGTDFLYF